MLSRLISRVPRRQFSKYIEDNYGKEVHRLANRPGIEVSPLEVFVYACGSFLLVADVSGRSRVETILKDSCGPQTKSLWESFKISPTCNPINRLLTKIFRWSVITKFIAASILKMEALKPFGINAFGSDQINTASVLSNKDFTRFIFRKFWKTLPLIYSNKKS